MPVIVRLNDVDRSAASHPLAAAHGDGQLGPLTSEFLYLSLECPTLGAAGSVSLDRLIDRKRDIGYGFHHKRSLRYPTSTAESHRATTVQPSYPGARGEVLSERSESPAQRRQARGLGQEIGDFLCRIPLQLVALRAVHDEPGVLVARIGRRQGGDCRRDLAG